MKHREAARLKREREGDWLGEREAERERERDRVIKEAVRLVTEREVKRHYMQAYRLPCPACLEFYPVTTFTPIVTLHAGLPFTMPRLLRILSSHHIYPHRGTTCRPTVYHALLA